MFFSEILEQLPEGHYSGIFDQSEKIYEINITDSVAVSFYPYKAMVTIDDKEELVSYSQLSHFKIKKEDSTEGLELYFEEKLIYSSIEEEDNCENEESLLSSLFSSVRNGFREAMYDDTIYNFVEIATEYFTEDETCSPGFEVSGICQYLNWEFSEDFNKALYVFLFKYKKEFYQFAERLKSEKKNCLWTLMADNTYETNQTELSDTFQDDSENTTDNSIDYFEDSQRLLLLLNDGIYYLEPDEDTITKLHSPTLTKRENKTVSGSFDIYNGDKNKTAPLLTKVSLEVATSFYHILKDLASNPVNLEEN